VPFTEIEWMDLYCIDIISPVHQPQPDLNHIDLRQYHGVVVFAFTIESGCDGALLLDFKANMKWH